MEGQARADGQYLVPHLTSSSPQFGGRPSSERLTPYQEGMDKLHMNSHTPQIESGYSSMASSQNYPASSDLGEQGEHRHGKLQPLVNTSMHDNVISGVMFTGSSEIKSTCTLSPPINQLSINQLSQLSEGASKYCIVDELKHDNDIPRPPLLQFAPPLAPALMAHPDFLGGEGLVSSPPTTPPKIQSTADPINSNSLPSTPPPAAIAGAKRTSSGTVKLAASLSVPNSPTEVDVYTPSLYQGRPPTVDAGRIQEVRKPIHFSFFRVPFKFYVQYRHSLHLFSKKLVDTY